MTVAALDLRDVHAGYGPFRALFGVSISVPPGGAVAVLGANGAGKTTLARVASGLVAPTEGSVFVDGADLSGRRPYRFARAGVAHAVEGRSVFASLTVEENLVLSFRRSVGRRGSGAAVSRAFELFPALADKRARAAGTLSGGEQRMLSLAGVVVEAPKVLIADELSLGLAPVIIHQVYEMLGRVREAGTALLIIEQHVDHALALCDDAVLLSGGSIAFEGAADGAHDVIASSLFEGIGDA